MKWTSRANENIPHPHRKLTTELDADPIKLFPGAIDLMNPQNPCPRCGRSGFGRADVTSGRHCPLSAPGTLFRKPFSIEAAVAYVEGLDAHGKTMAREYLKKAPDFVQTPVRQALQGFLERGDQTP